MYSQRFLNLFTLALALDISRKAIKHFKEPLRWSWITHLRWGFYCIVCGKRQFTILPDNQWSKEEKKLRPAKFVLICKASEKDYLFDACWQTSLRIMMKVLNFKHMLTDKSDEILIFVKYLYRAFFFPFRYFSMSINGYGDRMWYVGYILVLE